MLAYRDFRDVSVVCKRCANSKSMLADHPVEAAISRLAGVLQQGLAPAVPHGLEQFSESVSRNIGGWAKMRSSSSVANVS